jgi:cytochrome P450
MTANTPAAKACPYSNASTDFDPFNLENPFPFYEWARAQAPVFYAADLGYFVVSRYAEIKAIFDDWQRFASDNAQAPVRPLCDEARRIMREGGFTAYSGLSARIPPDHTRIRKVVQSCFGPRRFQAIEPAIRAIVTRAIDAFDPGGKIDFLRAFAYDVPALVLFKLVGIPDSDVPKVKLWSVSRALLTWGNLSDEEQLPHARTMLVYWNYCLDLVRQRHADPTDDLPGDLVRLQAEGAEITDEEIAGVCYSVLFAGHETTTALMANGVRELLTYRHNWEALLEDKSRIPGAIDEILRFSPSVIAWRRRATRATQIGGVDIPENANLLLLLGSANRDATMFENGETFDITRPNARNHLSFGYGIHFCVGQQLAKLEFVVALEELTRRVPSLRIAPAQTIDFARITSFRVPSQLLVEWDSR